MAHTPSTMGTSAHLFLAEARMLTARLSLCRRANDGGGIGRGCGLDVRMSSSAEISPPKKDSRWRVYLHGMSSERVGCHGIQRQESHTRLVGAGEGRRDSKIRRDVRGVGSKREQKRSGKQKQLRLCGGADKYTDR